MTAASSTPPNLAIVGAGRVGRSLHATALAAGVPTTLVNRNRAPGATSSAEIVLLCVGDDEIAELATDLAGEIAAGAVIGHTSGATPISALADAARGCAGSFGLHPLQTIPSGETSLDSVPCAVSASDTTTGERARALASALGMEPFAIAEDDRAAYHAAATIASNFLFALEESAATLLATADVDRVRATLAPLVLTTARNWADHGVAALTGPIARGDERTIERHLAAIAERAPELLALYGALAARTRTIAKDPEPVG